MKRQTGFTLIELIIVIVVIGTLAAVPVPTYQDMRTDAKIGAVKSCLGTFRESISNWSMRNVVSGGAATWPPRDSLARIGVVLLQDIPDNPFQAVGRAPDSIVLGVTKGVVVGTRGGWAYKPSTGEIWANTNTTIPGSGCSGPQTIGENSF